MRGKHMLYPNTSKEDNYSNLPGAYGRRFHLQGLYHIPDGDLIRFHTPITPKPKPASA